jgi:hypothetical protein
VQGIERLAFVLAPGVRRSMLFELVIPWDQLHTVHSLVSGEFHFVATLEDGFRCNSICVLVSFQLFDNIRPREGQVSLDRL